MSLLENVDKKYQITEESLKELGFKKRYEHGTGNYWSYEYRPKYDSCIEYWDKDYKGPAHAGGIPLNGKVFVSGTMYHSSLRKKQFISYIMDVGDMIDMMSILDNVKQEKVPSYIELDNIFI